MFDPDDTIPGETAIYEPIPLQLTAVIDNPFIHGC